MTRLKERYFGDTDAVAEARKNKRYFDQSFVMPESLPSSLFSNRMKFILTGRKGVGKSAYQLNLANNLERKGYLTEFLNFTNDFSIEDHQHLARSSSMPLDEIDTSQPVKNYNFFEIWKRVIFKKIATALQRGSFDTDFVKFVGPVTGPKHAFLEGFSRNFRLKLEGNVGFIKAQIEQVANEKVVGSDIDLRSFNYVAERLILDGVLRPKLYLFIDEIILSRLDLMEDEVALKLAMIRDLLRAASYLNQKFAADDMDIHVMCSLRPDIRTMIEDIEPEISKVIETQSTELLWLSENQRNFNQFVEIFAQKIRFSDEKEPIRVPTHVEMINKKLTVDAMLKKFTWGRPRDIVRLLNCVADAAGNEVEFSERIFSAGYEEYSRRSKIELIEEISSIYGPQVRLILDALFIKRRLGTRLEVEAKLAEFTIVKDLNIDPAIFVEELFAAGFIGGSDVSRGTRYHNWSYRRSEKILPDWQVQVHNGLWKTFGIGDK